MEVTLSERVVYFLAGLVVGLGLFYVIGVGRYQIVNVGLIAAQRLDTWTGEVRHCSIASDSEYFCGHQNR